MIQNFNINKGEKVYFASDFHLGTPSKEDSLAREKRIVKCPACEKKSPFRPFFWRQKIVLIPRRRFLDVCDSFSFLFESFFLSFLGQSCRKVLFIFLSLFYSFSKGQQKEVSLSPLR